MGLGLGLGLGLGSGLGLVGVRVRVRVRDSGRGWGKVREATVLARKALQRRPEEGGPRIARGQLDVGVAL